MTLPSDLFHVKYYLPDPEIPMSFSLRLFSLPQSTVVSPLPVCKVCPYFFLTQQFRISRPCYAAENL